MTTAKLTKPQIIHARLNTFEIGDTINKRNYVFTIYRDHNMFIERSFDVHFGKAKKMMPEKVFKTIGGMITRIS